jgi:histidyl-tRNA synthetase
MLAALVADAACRRLGSVRSQGGAALGSVPARCLAVKVQQLAAPRGMHVHWPASAALRRGVEDVFLDVAGRHGFDAVELPVVEDARVYQRTMGDGSDVVMKEMFRVSPPATHAASAAPASSVVSPNVDAAKAAAEGGEAGLVLRPEGTAGLIRAAVADGMLRPGSHHRWAYSGPMFRSGTPRGRVK